MSFSSMIVMSLSLVRPIISLTLPMTPFLYFLLIYFLKSFLFPVPWIPLDEQPGNCSLQPEHLEKAKISFDYVLLPENRGVIKQKEISGITYSRKYPGHFWGVNDSGNGQVLYLYDQTNAKLRKSFILHGILNTDWEDMTIGKDSNQEDVLYIGDIGDNKARRASYNLYQFKEPEAKKLDGKVANILLEFNVMKYQYADGARDAESLAYDPVEEKLYVISKREKNVGIYVLPNEFAEETYQAVKMGTLPMSNVVAADFSANGQRFILKTYSNIFLWERNTENQPFCEMIISTPCILPYSMEPQGESICFFGESYATVSEQRFSIEPRLLTHDIK